MKKYILTILIQNKLIKAHKRYVIIMFKNIIITYCNQHKIISCMIIAETGIRLRKN